MEGDRMKKLLFVDDDNDFLESNRLYFQKNSMRSSVRTGRRRY